ncbi:unnamed protein product [Phytophthora fragariaefolia]|uniref:Unnamed protein product n=1 Tax=Phytophthora fragariaefolia TaxID=1490495 RepID=A0A9W6Y339_9STRA|nr:unnamed protein product [Phytophthora fragariaefolia]
MLFPIPIVLVLNNCLPGPEMSSGLSISTTFGRAIIDKATGDHRRRFSLHRSIRYMTNNKTRQKIFRTLTSPITPKGWASTVRGIIVLVVHNFQWIYLPLFTCYYPDGTSTTSAIAISLESFYLLNLLLHFNTAYVKQGLLITSRRKIGRHYIRTWFTFDLLSAIPVQVGHCIASGSVQSTSNFVRGIQITFMVLRLLRVTFLEKDTMVARVMRVANRLTEWARYSRYSHLLGIAQLMWLVLLIAHYMACFWHLVSCDNRSHNVQMGTVGQKYIADYYYAVSLIQGQGNSGGTWGEDLFSSVAIIVGSVILAIVFGNVAMLVLNFNANTTNYHRKMEAVYETMKKMDLPLRLRDRINEYYKHAWLEYEALDGNVSKFQHELTHTLGIEVGLYKHMDLVVKVPFWKDCTPDFLTQIVQNLDVRVYMPDDYVVRRRETGNEMMMINHGEGATKQCCCTDPKATSIEEERGGGCVDHQQSNSEEPSEGEEPNDGEEPSDGGKASGGGGPSGGRWPSGGGSRAIERSRAGGESRRRGCIGVEKEESARKENVAVGDASR